MGCTSRALSAHLSLVMVPPTPTSSLPPAAPAEALRRPYQLMALLRTSMTSSSGGYVTRRLHVPRDVWSTGGSKLLALPEKARVIEILTVVFGKVRALLPSLPRAGGR
jgi:hypothetical protein